MLKVRKLLYVVSIGLLIPAGCCFPIPKLPKFCNECITNLLVGLSSLADIAAVIRGGTI